MDVLLVVGGRESTVGGAVLRAVDFLSQVLDAHPDREGFGLGADAHAVYQLEGVARAVTDGEDDLAAFYKAARAFVLDLGGGDSAVLADYIGELGVEINVGSEAYQLFADALDGGAELIGAYMWLCVAEYILRRSVGDEFEQHLARSAVLGAGVQLAV